MIGELDRGRAVKLKRGAGPDTRAGRQPGGVVRRKGRFESCLEQAREQVEARKRQIEEDPGAMSRRS